MNLGQFETWALDQGQVGNPGLGNGSYPGQCVSLVQCYLYYVYGIEYQARGNAKDWPSNADVLSYFDVVSNIQAGDIIVYGADYGGGYGHIGISTNGQILDQNGRQSLHIAIGAIYPNVMAILRRKGEEDMKIDLFTGRRILYSVAGMDGRDGRPNALDGSQDKDIQKNWVDPGRDTNEVLQQVFDNEGKTYRNELDKIYAGQKYQLVTDKLYREEK